MEKGKWRSVCTNSRNWTALDLGVACQQLGFTGGEWHHCKMIVISTRSSLLNHYQHSSQASSLIFNLSPKFVLPLFTSTFLTVVKNKTLGYSTIYSLRLRDSRDSQDSETPETPRLPRLLSYYFSIFLYFRFTTFSNFSNSSDSKVKVKVKGPNICYIFEKHGIQGC